MEKVTVGEYTNEGKIGAHLGCEVVLTVRGRLWELFGRGETGSAFGPIQG